MTPYRQFRPSLRFWPVVSLSPDGGTVAYVDDRSGQLNLMVQPVDGGPARALTSFADRSVRRVAWHPGGRWLVFLADSGGDESHQIFRVDLAGGVPEQLTDSPGVQYFAALGDPFSPDGRRLAYAGNDRVPGDQDVLVRDLTTGQVRRLYAEGGKVNPGHWSPDGARLSAVEWRDANSDHVIHLVPAGGGPARRLTDPTTTALYRLGPWLPDGSGFLVASDAGREFAGIAVMDAGTGALTWLETPDWDVDEVTLSADGRRLVWLADVEGASRLRGRDLGTGADLPMPALPTGHAQELTLSADGQVAAMLLSTPTSPWNVVVADLATGRLRWLTDAAPTGADPARFVEPELVHYPARDGTLIPAYLYRPPGTGPTGVVMCIHGGPVTQERPAYQDGIYQHLVHHGVAVFAPNVRGSSGYGRSYQMRIYRDWGGIDLDDFAAAHDHLRKQSWVDPARIGLYGGSYGGFAVLSCLARRPELDWAAGVDLCGISNLVTLARTAPPTWRTLVNAIIGNPDTDEDLLRSRSPVTYADQIRAPLFVLQGANDPRVPQAESDQIVQRLRARGVEVRYDVYPDEGHGFTKRDNQIRARSDIAEFLIAHLAS
jgi:dipeptidyl aminopeptidase/acylaminoacyl peptidase